MEIPKGKLIPIGGNEDKGEDEFSTLNFLEAGILRRVLSEMKGRDSRVEVITTASGMPRKTGENYLSAFAKLGCKEIGLLHIRKRDQADKLEYIRRIREADGVLFSGGDQLVLAMVIGGTKFLEVLTERYMNENFVIAGTSAGAMAMSTTMIYQGSSINALLKDEVKITPGLGLIKDVIIDTHFIHRGRFGRLAQAIARNPSSIGLGLGEDTGAVISDGNKIEVIGSGLVIILDGHNIKYCNISEITDGSPLSIENITVHILARGNCFRLQDKSFFPTAAECNMVETDKS